MNRKQASRRHWFTETGLLYSELFFFLNDQPNNKLNWRNYPLERKKKTLKINLRIGICHWGQAFCFFFFSLYVKPTFLSQKYDSNMEPTSLIINEKNHIYPKIFLICIHETPYSMCVRVCVCAYLFHPFSFLSIFRLHHLFWLWRVAQCGKSAITPGFYKQQQTPGTQQKQG